MSTDDETPSPKTILDTEKYQAALKNSHDASGYFIEAIGLLTIVALLEKGGTTGDTEFDDKVKALSSYELVVELFPMLEDASKCMKEMTINLREAEGFEDPPKNIFGKFRLNARLLNKIKALMNKTVENGCSEDEALSAAKVLGELMDSHGISMSNIQDFKDGSSDGPEMGSEYVENKGVNLDETRLIAVMIATFFDCQAIAMRFQTGGSGRRTSGRRITYFGFKQDVDACVALTNIIRTAMEQEYRAFEASKKAVIGAHGKTLRKSFMLGFSNRMNQRLFDLKQSRKVASNSTALVIVKDQLVKKFVQEEVGRVKKGTTTRSTVNNSAYSAGSAAADRVNLESRQGVTVTKKLAA